MNRQALALTTGLLVSPVQAEVPPPAYQLATHGTSVPSEVLYALALQESGISLRGKLVPWPWTLNVATVPYRFPNRNSACSALLQAIHTVGPKRVDAGLGQLNIGWQRHRFAEPCDVLDPYLNLALTTKVLLEQKVSGTDWTEAAGRYHRPAGGSPAARYREGFSRHLQRVTATSNSSGDRP
ncbi:lytic transglycosylase domain-containing protein [Pseudomonas sp. NA-150]|uniref:lytic transglycosylase domain-containing protein n=1 Tax=Pseudomonas sp. NA-150 TaxID=3367525 RepID=UPI0037C640C3